ncbi:hypothetical protein B0H14DRAFT_3453921 [Mycena olivaceomarginata]|nr:hypothetical protein B0H14DRAFT_3453921 [Mycena olivaceomarginata]
MSAPVVASQMRTVSSLELDTTRVPSGENATDETKSLWPTILVTSAPVVASQIHTVLSSEPDTTRAPSGENATERLDNPDFDGAFDMSHGAPAILGNAEVRIAKPARSSEVTSILLMSAPVVASQMRTVSSLELDTTRVPSGENATDETKSLWPTILVTSAPVVASQIHTVLSSEPDTTRAPSGENATERLDNPDFDGAFDMSHGAVRPP